MILLMVATGVILFSLGVIAEYVGLAVNMAMGKPLYLPVRDRREGPLGRDAGVSATGLAPPRLGRRRRAASSAGTSSAELRAAGHEVLTTAVPWARRGRQRAQPSPRRWAGSPRRVAAGRGRWPGAPARASSPRARRPWPAEVRVFERVTGGAHGIRAARVRTASSSSRRRPAGSTPGRRPAPFDERTEPRPLVAYGRAKLAMEEAVRRARAPPASASVLGRLANVYGPGQTLGKPQGLLSQLCLADATGRPLPVFVSMDTIRDYLYAGDAGADGRARHRARPRRAGRHASSTKVLASGRPVTVGYLVSEARRVFHRPLRTIPVGGCRPGQVLDLRLSPGCGPRSTRSPRRRWPPGSRRTSADVRARVVSGGPLDG